MRWNTWAYSIGFCMGQWKQKGPILTNYRVSISSFDFKFRFQVSISSFDFEFRFLVSISSFDFEFRFQVSISSFDFEFRFPISISSFDFKFRFWVSISSFDFEFRFHVLISSSIFDIVCMQKQLHINIYFGKLTGQNGTGPVTSHPGRAGQGQQSIFCGTGRDWDEI